MRRCCHSLVLHPHHHTRSRHRQQHRVHDAAAAAARSRLRWRSRLLLPWRRWWSRSACSSSSGRLMGTTAWRLRACTTWAAAQSNRAAALTAVCTRSVRSSCAPMLTATAGRTGRCDVFWLALEHARKDGRGCDELGRGDGAEAVTGWMGGHLQSGLSYPNQHSLALPAVARTTTTKTATTSTHHTNRTCSWQWTRPCRCSASPTLHPWGSQLRRGMTLQPL